MEPLCPAWSLYGTSYFRATGRLLALKARPHTSLVERPSDRTGLPWDWEARATRQTVTSEEPQGGSLRPPPPPPVHSDLTPSGKGLPMAMLVS